MTIKKANIDWQSLAWDGTGQLTYRTIGCDDVHVHVRRMMGELTYALTFSDAHDGGPWNRLSTRLTPQAWRAMREDIAQFAHYL